MLRRVARRECSVPEVSGLDGRACVAVVVGVGVAVVVGVGVVGPVVGVRTGAMVRAVVGSDVTDDGCASPGRTSSVARVARHPVSVTLTTTAPMMRRRNAGDERGASRVIEQFTANGVNRLTRRVDVDVLSDERAFVEAAVAIVAA